MTQKVATPDVNLPWGQIPASLWTKIALFVCDSARSATHLAQVNRSWRARIYLSSATTESERFETIYVVWEHLCKLRWDIPSTAQRGDWLWYYKDRVAQQADYPTESSLCMTGATNSYAYEFHKGEFLVSGKALCIHEAEVPAWNSPNLTGLSVWNAGVVGAKYFEHKETQTRDWCAGKSVIELGCGTGILGIAFALTNPTYRVLCTDTEDVLQLTQTNIEANLPLLRCAEVPQHVCSVGARVTSYPLRWENFACSTSLPGLMETFDIIILSDVVWYMEGVAPLVSALCALTHETSLVICCFQSRHIDVDLAFWHLVGRYFEVVRLPSAQLHPDFKNPLVTLYEFRRLKSKNDSE